MCSESFLYWLLTYVRIEDKLNGGDIPFALWECQVDAVKQILKSIYIFILKARQLGLTWLCAAYALWKSMFRVNQLIVVISAKEDLAIQFLDRVKFMFDRLPEWMKPHVYKRTNQIMHFGYEEKDNKGNMKVSGLNSQILSLTTTPSGAQSMTINLLILDEASLIENVRTIWGSSKPGVDSVKGQIVVIANPIKTGPGWSWFRDNFVNAWRGLAGRMKFLFIAWNQHPGRGASFIEDQLKEGYDEDLISQHYPTTIEEAIGALTGNYFGKVLQRHTEFVKGRVGHLAEELDEMKFFEAKHGVLEVWKEPEGDGYRNRHVIFSDVSEGLGQNYSVAYLFDRVTDEFIAKLKSNHIDPDQWGMELIKLAKWAGDTPVICPERNGAGQTTIVTLKRKQYPRIYRSRAEDKAKSTVKSDYGWSESGGKGGSKALLVNSLKMYLRDCAKSVPDGELIDQCSTFIKHPDGYLGAEDETKLDDCVIAAGGCVAVSNTLPEPEQVQKQDIKPILVPQTWRERLGIGTSATNPWVY